MSIPQILPKELREELRGTNPPVLLDVREGHELDISKLEFQHHIPIGELSKRYEELSPTANIVVYCRTGHRSGKATEFLLGKGFENVRNLVGGINGWAEAVDSSVTIY